MRKVAQLARRTFLMQVGRGSFALLEEMTLGLGRRGLAVALGGSSLLAACAPIQRLAESSPSTAASNALDAINYITVFNQFVNAFVLVRGSEIAIVDSGIEGTGAMIGEAIMGAGLDWAAVNHLIFTHYHPDHIGSMSEIMQEASQATIYAGSLDIPQIRANKVTGVGDGDEVFGLQIIDTPGHTEGHISVLDPVGSLVIVGDAMTNQEGKLAAASPQFTKNMTQANESIKKLATLKYDRILFGHGTEITSGGSDAIAKLAATL